MQSSIKINIPLDSEVWDGRTYLTLSAKTQLKAFCVILLNNEMLSWFSHEDQIKYLREHNLSSAAL